MWLLEATYLTPIIKVLSPLDNCAYVFVRNEFMGENKVLISNPHHLECNSNIVLG